MTNGKVLPPTMDRPNCHKDWTAVANNCDDYEIDDSAQISYNLFLIYPAGCFIVSCFFLFFLYIDRGRESMSFGDWELKLYVGAMK